MCLYPKLIQNPKYKKNKKNGGVIPPVPDKRVTLVPIGCQKCMECRKQKAREWQVRLTEDIKEYKNGKFITLSFSDESLTNLQTDISEKWEGYDIDNEIATLAVRRFLERWRKKYKKSLRHWLVTELGQNSTERIHLHGIIWTDETKQTVTDIWQYGNTGYGRNWKDNYVNGATVNYIVKYLNKADAKHPNYQSKILTSKGIGSRYTQTGAFKDNTYNEKGETREHYKTTTGHKIGLPIYYRNKLYSDKQKEQLWINKLDKQERWVNGVRIDISQGEDNYYAALAWAQKRNLQLGYGSDIKNWEQEEYEKQRRNLKKEARKKK